MATFDALERLQKFDWLIQKLHTLRNSLHTDQGLHSLQELHKLHALQLLPKSSDYPYNGASSVGGEEEEEEEKMEMVSHIKMLSGVHCPLPPSRGGQRGVESKTKLHKSFSETFRIQDSPPRSSSQPKN